MPISPDVLTLDPPSRLLDIVRRTHGWTRLIAILWMISSGLMVVGGVVAGLGLAATGRPEMMAIALVYPVIGLMYFFPSMYLLRFANQARTYVTSGTVADLETALDSQRSFWKFAGVMTLVAMGLVCLAFVGGIVFGALAARGARL
jgi:hypothetical protein